MCWVRAPSTTLHTRQQAPLLQHGSSTHSNHHRPALHGDASSFSQPWTACVARLWWASWIHSLSVCLLVSPASQSQLFAAAASTTQSEGAPAQAGHNHAAALLLQTASDYLLVAFFWWQWLLYSTTPIMLAAWQPRTLNQHMLSTWLGGLSLWARRAPHGAQGF